MKSTHAVGSELFLPVVKLPVLNALVMSGTCGFDTQDHGGAGFRVTVSDLFSVRATQDRFGHTVVSFGCAYTYGFGRPREEG